MTASEEALPCMLWKRWGAEGPVLWPQKAARQRASGGAGLGWWSGQKEPRTGQGRARVLAASEEASPCCVCD